MKKKRVTQMEKCRIFYRNSWQGYKSRSESNCIDQSERIRSNDDESYYTNRLRNIHSVVHVARMWGMSFNHGQQSCQDTTCKDSGDLTEARQTPTYLNKHISLRGGDETMSAYLWRTSNTRSRGKYVDRARPRNEIYSTPTTTFPTTSGLRIMQDKNHELQIDCHTIEASRIRYWNDRIPLILRYHFFSLPLLFRCSSNF